MRNLTKAEKYLRASTAAFDEIEAAGFPEGDTRLNRVHYYLQFANAHTLLAQVEAQSAGFGSVERMADSVVQVNHVAEQKENN